MNAMEMNFIIQFDSQSYQKKAKKSTKFADMSSSTCALKQSVNLHTGVQDAAQKQTDPTSGLINAVVLDRSKDLQTWYLIQHFKLHQRPFQY